jgi:O-antigen ligase
MNAIIFAVFMLKKRACIRFSHVIWLGYLIVSSYFSYDSRPSNAFIRLFIMLILLFFLDISIEYWDKLIIALQVITFVIAITIIAEVFVSDLVSKYLWFFITPKSSQIPIIEKYKKMEQLIGAYSGIAGEKADAAFYMCIGIGIIMVNYCIAKKLNINKVILFSIYTIALLLTGKRTLFICAILFSLVIILLSEIHKKYVKLLVGATCIVFGILLAQMFIPEINTVFERFQSNDSLEVRYDMWDYEMRMFQAKPLFGFGFASFNLLYSPRGTYAAFGHNIYIELLAETGIVGILLFIFSNIFLIKDLWKVYKKRKQYGAEYNKIFYFMIYILGLWYVYGLTGNVMYYKFQIFIYFILHYMVGTLLREPKEVYQLNQLKSNRSVLDAEVLHSKT